MDQVPHIRFASGSTEGPFCASCLRDVLDDADGEQPTVFYEPPEFSEWDAWIDEGDDCRCDLCDEVLCYGEIAEEVLDRQDYEDSLMDLHRERRGVAL